VAANDDDDKLLRSAVLQNASSILIARQRAERRSEAYLAEAQRLSHTGSFGWRASSGEIIWSEETFRIFQYDRTMTPSVELVLQRVHPEDAALVKQTMERASQDGKDFDFEHRLLMPDGSVKHVHVVAHALSDESGSVEFVGAVMDVTERKRVEALRDAESRIAGLLCSVLLLEEDGRHARHGAAPSLPQPYSEAIDGLSIGPKAGSCGTAMYRREPVIVTDILQDPLWEQYRDVAEPYGLRSCWSTPILAHSGKALGSFAMYYRETRSPSPAETRALEMATHLAGIAIERKLAREERERFRQAQADLAHINRVTTMGELTASLAHEVNQPIAAAVTDANTCLRWLTRDQPDLEEARQAASRIVKDATRAAEVISRTRLLFRKGTPQRALVDVNEVIREMIGLLRSEAMRHSISVRTDLADLPQVMGDRVQLQQVLLNLMTNSIDAMKDVDGTRELIICSQQAEDDRLLVSVIDTGLGLPPEQANQIFDAFFTTKPHGTGMGLRISRSIVEAHGGRLWAAENSSRGASFHLTLPIKVDAHEMP